jgi:hypothetical protein
MRNVIDFGTTLGGILGVGLLMASQPQYSSVSSQEASNIRGAACANLAIVASDVCSTNCGTSRVNAPVSGGSASPDAAVMCKNVANCTAQQTVSGTCGG